MIKEWPEDIKQSKEPERYGAAEVNVQQGKVKVKLSGVSQTMLNCLWRRAQLSKKYSSLFYDEKAIELVEKIDYDDLAASDDGPLEDLERSFFRTAQQVDQPEFGLFAESTAV
jgi:O-methyltransferase involved in polyketide biosynthesis